MQIELIDQRMHRLHLADEVSQHALTHNTELKELLEVFLFDEAREFCDWQGKLDWESEPVKLCEFAVLDHQR